jgi:hypothetical protein
MVNVFVLFGVMVSPVFGQMALVASGALAIPKEMIPLDLAEGEKRLSSTPYNQAFWVLVPHFETQVNQAYCAVASSVMVLNALKIERPLAEQYKGYHYFTQQNFFNTVDPSIAKPEQVHKEGMTLDQLAKSLSTGFSVVVEKNYASDLSVDSFREKIKEGVGSKNTLVLLNFNRSVLGEEGKGHWSPIAAYDPKTDSALMLDVAKYKYPPLWISVESLYKAAMSVDSTSGMSRGILLVRAK